MLSDHLLEKLNHQMNLEFYSSNLYLAMASYCLDQSWDGFANFFIVQAEEERYHGMKIFHFIDSMGKRAKLEGMEAPQNDFSSVLDAFSHAYEHEKFVTRNFYELSDIALNEKEHATRSFLTWFIDEQVEEEALFDGILQKLRRITESSDAFFQLDSSFAERKFTPEDEE